jgi:hypothetical protein
VSPCGSVASIFDANAGGIARESFKLGIWSRGGEDLCVPCRNSSATLTLKRAGHDGGTASFLAATDDLIDERDQVIWQANRDLLAHTKMVPARDAPEWAFTSFHATTRISPT